MRKKKLSKEKIAIREIAKKLHVSSWTIWKTMDKIKLRFERNRALIYFMEDFNPESVVGEGDLQL